MFSLNSVTKIFVYSKRTRTCHSSTSCVRDQNATTAPARHIWDTGSLNWTLFMLQWFIKFPEFTEFSESSALLGKTPMCRIYYRTKFIRTLKVYIDIEIYALFYYRPPTKLREGNVFSRVRVCVFKERGTRTLTQAPVKHLSPSHCKELPPGHDMIKLVQLGPSLLPTWHT